MHMKLYSYRKALRHDIREQIYNLYKKGHTQCEISMMFGVSQSTVLNYIRQMKYEKQIEEIKRLIKSDEQKGNRYDDNTD